MTIRSMPTHQEMSDMFVSIMKKRRVTHGKWMPTSCWIDKLDIDGADNKKFKKASDVTDKCM